MSAKFRSLFSFQRVILSGIFTILLISCKQKPPPISHQWSAKPVLIELFHSPGFVDFDYAWTQIPNFVLYADGRLLISVYEYKNYEYIRTIWSKQISTREACNLMAQIEHDGFFEFDEGAYQEPEITDVGTAHIVVNAWQENQVSAYALEYLLAYQNEYDESEIPDPLAQTYLRLLRYSRDGMMPFQPEKVHILIKPIDYDIAAPLWPKTEPSLASLASKLIEFQSGSLTDVQIAEEAENLLHGYILKQFEGPLADEIYTLFDGRLSKTFNEDGTTYRLFIRPLLPLEQATQENVYGFQPHFPDIPETDWTCTFTTNPQILAIPMAPTRSSQLVAEGNPKLQAVTELGRRDAPGQLADHTPAIAVNDRDEIAVADIGNNRLQWFSPGGTFLRMASLSIPGNARINYMTYVSQDTLLLVGNNEQIFIVSEDGKLLKTWSDWPFSGAESITDLFTLPDQNGTYYQSEIYSNYIKILNTNNQTQETWHGPQDNPFSDIRFITSDLDGSLYVVSSPLENRVVRRKLNGQIEEFFAEIPMMVAPLPDTSFYVVGERKVAYFSPDDQASREWDISELSYPVDVATTSDGSLILLGNDFRSPKIIYRFDRNGELLANFGNTQDLPGQIGPHSSFSVSSLGDIWFVDEDWKESIQSQGLPRRLVHLDEDGNHLNTYFQLMDAPLLCDQYLVEALSNNTVFVADVCQGTIMHINQEGVLLHHWGQRGLDHDQFNLISDLTLAPDENSLFVVDAGHRFVTQFSLDGQRLREWPANELGLQKPIALAIDDNDTFYLLDGARQQIVIRSQGYGLQTWTLPNNNDGVKSIAVDTNHNRVYIGGTDSLLYVFTENGEFSGSTDIVGSRGTIVDVSPSGRVYASTGYHRIYLYDPIDN